MGTIQYLDSSLNPIPFVEPIDPAQVAAIRAELASLTAAQFDPKQELFVDWVYDLPRSKYRELKTQLRAQVDQLSSWTALWRPGFLDETGRTQLFTCIANADILVSQAFPGFTFTAYIKGQQKLPTVES